MKMDDKNHEVECLVHHIKEVELAKKQKPDMYKKALGLIKGEVEVISSIEDLRKIKAIKAELPTDTEEDDQEDADE